MICVGQGDDCHLVTRMIFFQFLSADLINCCINESRADTRHGARVGGCGGAYRVLVGRPEGRRPRGRSRRRWEAWSGLIWLSIWASGGRFVSAIMIIQVT